jgi:hypothetical protein
LGVVLRNCADGNVTGNAIHGTGDIPAAIYLKNCKGINMTGNSVYQPRGAAFLLEGVRSSRVSGSLIRVTDARQVIVQRNSGPNQIVNNLIDRESN